MDLYGTAPAAALFDESQPSLERVYVAGIVKNSSVVDGSIQVNISCAVDTYFDYAAVVVAAGIVLEPEGVVKLDVQRAAAVDGHHGRTENYVRTKILIGAKPLMIRRQSRRGSQSPRH